MTMGKSTLNQINHGRKRGHCTAVMMRRRGRIVVQTRKQGGQGTFLRLAEIALQLFLVKTAAVNHHPKMTKLKKIMTTIMRNTPTAVLECKSIVSL